MSPSKSSSHELWMARALALAEKGRDGVSPNPMVGACVVKAGRLIAEGYHALYGEAHAEAVALQKAGKKAKGATLYVTLEPCSSWGKTPPCVSAVIAAGVREVVIASLDPNPQNYKKGIEALKKAGIKVTSGILQEEAERQNQAFFKFIKTGMPFVTLKMAQSLDGKIATRTGHSRWITSPPAREFVHDLRREQDAVLVGTGTLRKDDPFLSPREIVKGRETKPWRVVLDAKNQTPAKARIFQGDQLTILAVSEKRIRHMKNTSGSRTLLPVKEQKGKLDLKDLLKKLGGLGVSKLLVEGGGEVAWSFVEQKLVDKIYWILAPKFIGGRDSKTSLEGDGVKLASDAVELDIIGQMQLGDDLLIEAELH